ncbi:MAG: DUF6064 family protein [bacterium]
MSEWWSYKLEDLVLFSADAYYRQFALLNEATWPAPLITPLLGLVLTWLVPRYHRHRLLISCLLGLTWISVAVFYLWDFYQHLNWAGIYIVYAFILQAILLPLCAFSAQQSTTHRLYIATAPVMLVVASIGYPVLSGFLGGGWNSLETLGLAPDPTVLATLAFTMLLTGWRRWLMLIIPGIWTAMNAATLWVLEVDYWWLLPLAITLVVLSPLIRLIQPTVDAVAPK